MKLSSLFLSMTTPRRLLQSSTARDLILVLTFSAPLALSAAQNGKTFATPDEAVSAVAAAARANDFNALRSIFGPRASDLENPDRVQATNELRTFASTLSQTNRIVRESESRCVLELGDGLWPFPVPLLKRDGRWFFDTQTGIEELLNRRIGRNELSTLQSVRAYVEAQREYSTRDRDGDEVLEFAQKFGSSPDQKDGLYWSPDLDGEISPLGPLVAEAQAQGYRRSARGKGGEPQPFHGYLFKVLTRQGKLAPGGNYDFVINGNMIGGFALVAWPAEYGHSGIMTFIVNQQGRVHQKDLGLKTANIAAGMKEYNSDRTWTISRE